MKAETYFNKTGNVYGISSKYEFGRWNHVCYKFNDLETALKWLNTEEYDFRTRELCSKTKARKLCGSDVERLVKS